MEENWNKSIVCFDSGTPLMAIPISSRPPMKVPSIVSNGVIRKKRTPRMKVTEGIRVSGKKKEKVEKKLRKPLPFDLNLMPDEYDYEEGEKVCKRKKSSDSELRGSKKIKRSKEDCPKPLFSVPNPAPGLPDYVREVMERDGELDGEPVLVLQRILHGTDLSARHNRMAIPGKQVLSWGFLNDCEKGKLLSKDAIETDVIMPSLEKGEITLRKWKMGKNEGMKAGILALSGGWNTNRSTPKMRSKEYRLLRMMVVQVWAYRYRGLNNTVRFALVNVDWHPQNFVAFAEIGAIITAAEVADVARRN